MVIVGDIEARKVDKLGQGIGEVIGDGILPQIKEEVGKGQVVAEDGASNMHKERMCFEWKPRKGMTGFCS